jgi:hypothetical protein
MRRLLAIRSDSKIASAKPACAFAHAGLRFNSAHETW